MPKRRRVEEVRDSREERAEDWAGLRLMMGVGGRSIDMVFLAGPSGFALAVSQGAGRRAKSESQRSALTAPRSSMRFALRLLGFVGDTLSF